MWWTEVGGDMHVGTYGTVHVSGCVRKLEGKAESVHVPLRCVVTELYAFLMCMHVCRVRV